MKGDNTRRPPFEANDLRKNLAAFLDSDFHGMKVGNYRWGVYAFYDYDGEPIYVGQTNEMLRTRIRRHLTNQRTDAVAMSVLDPSEVLEIEVWPLPDLQSVTRKTATSEQYGILNAVEFSVFEHALKASHFGAVLNEKNPPSPTTPITLPSSVRRRVVSQEVFSIRSHPDSRIARRAATLARLAQVISERQVSVGLRKVLVTQAKRLQWLAERRVDAGADSDEHSESTEI